MNLKYIELEKLAKLKEQWILSEDEYLKEKEKILYEKNTILLPYSPNTILWLSFLFWPFSWLPMTYHNFKVLGKKNFLEKTWWIFLFLFITAIDLVFVEYDLPILVNIFYMLLVWLMNVWIFSNLQLDELKEWKNNNLDKAYKSFFPAIWWWVLNCLIWVICFVILLIIFNLIYPELLLLKD